MVLVNIVMHVLLLNRFLFHRFPFTARFFVFPTGYGTWQAAAAVALGGGNRYLRDESGSVSSDLKRREESKVK